MANLKRMNVLFNQQDLDKLKKIAQQEQTSVAYLIRKAVKKIYKT